MNPNKIINFPAIILVGVVFYGWSIGLKVDSQTSILFAFLFALNEWSRIDTFNAISVSSKLGMKVNTVIEVVFILNSIVTLVALAIAIFTISTHLGGNTIASSFLTLVLTILLFVMPLHSD